MLSRVQKNYEKEQNQVVEDEKLTNTEIQFLKKLYEEQTIKKTKRQFNINTFLNYGISITLVLLIIVLYIAFSK